MKTTMMMAVLAYLSATGMASVLRRTTEAVCDTTTGSPSSADCKDAIADLDADTCYELNGLGSGCKTIKTSGNCEVVVCIDDDLDTQYLLGSIIQYRADELLAACESDDRVGGYYHVDEVDETANESCDDTWDGYFNVEFVKT